MDKDRARDGMIPEMPPMHSDTEKKQKFRHTFIAPLLVAAVYLLLLITKTVNFTGAGASLTESYLALVAVQLLVFMLPCVLYIRFRSLDVREELRVRLPAPDKIMFIVLCTLILVITSVLLSAVGGSLGESVYSYGYISDSFDSSEGQSAALYYAVCFALVPALCEELLFRGIIMSEYQRTSVFGAVVINSLFFAMLHFDFANLPFFFFAGLILSMCAYAANSTIASFAVHLGYNLFAIFGGEVVDKVINVIGELTLILVFLCALLLLFLSLAFGECQRIYASYAKKNRDSFYVVKYKKGTGAWRFFTALFSPSSLVCILMFVVASLLRNIAWGGRIVTQDKNKANNTEKNTEKNTENNAEKKIENRPAPVDAVHAREGRRRRLGADDTAKTAESGRLHVDYVEDDYSQDDADDVEVQVSKINRTGTTPTFITGVIKSVVYLTTVIILSVFAAIGIIMVGNDVFALVKDDAVIEVTIPDGITIDEMADILYENKIINYPWAFKLYASFKDVDTSEFVAGTYQLSPMMNYDRLCVVFAPFEERKIVRLTIPEGSTVMDIIKIFTDAGIGTEQGFVDAINDYDYSEHFDFLPEVYAACTADRIYKLEGYLYPDTYDFYSDSKESQIIYKLLENFDSKFSEEMKADAAEAGFTMDQIVILASMVQKEAYYYEDYDTISSVFINRLHNSADYPKLESDATTVYAIELATGQRPDKLGDAELAFNSPYNTRVYNGFPPGAICNPGYDAIMCAIYPATTSYYYFVADNDGYNIFSKTYREHQQAVQSVINSRDDED